MSEKFANKVIAERLVLNKVNEYTSGRNQLTGLTSISIDSWARKNQLENFGSIKLVLLEISQICHRMTDRSKETFESIDKNYLNDIADKIPIVQKLLKEKFGIKGVSKL